MTNIWIYLATVFGYWIIWTLWTDGDTVPIPYKLFLKRLAIVAVLVLPLNINGNVYTVFGNAKSEKNVYSVLSLYQNAGNTALSVFGTLHQKAEKTR